MKKPRMLSRFSPGNAWAIDITVSRLSAKDGSALSRHS